METHVMAEFYKLCEEVVAVVGDALDDVEFANLVDRIAFERIVAVSW